MKKPCLVEIFTDNGEHSHYQLVDSENGSLIWSELVEDYDYITRDESIKSACMYFRHDFGLLDEEEKNRTKRQCELWIVALSKAMQDKRSRLTDDVPDQQVGGYLSDDRNNIEVI